jgi:uncharacterized protein YecE (DUF72 family)
VHYRGRIWVCALKGGHLGPPLRKTADRFTLNHARHNPTGTPNHKLYIGPAGWDYPDWQGVVYPPGLKGADRLTFLAALFTAVEINVTFYRPIPADYARRWLAAVADFPDFRFTAKVWQVFTHARQLPEADLAQFQAGLAPLLTAGKLGVLLAQFPYSFHNYRGKSGLSPNAQGRLTRLSPGSGGAPPLLAAAGRAGVFRRAGLDFCNIDQPMVSYPMGATRWVTGPRGYLRCHGRRKDAWFEFGTTVEPGMTTSTPPRNWRIWRPGPGSSAKAQETYVIFNNHPAGQAVANALELINLLQPGRKVNPPPGLMAAFPRLAQTVLTPKECGGCTV